MKPLSLLVLLLFATVARAATVMEELLGNGEPQRFKSWNDLYLTDERPAIKRSTLWSLPRQEWGRYQDWRMEQINDREVVIMSNRGYYIGHGSSDWAKQTEVADQGELLTAVQNADGSWSFKSRWNKWLSARAEYDPQRYYMYTPLMKELLADGGRRRFKSFDGLYLTYRETMLLKWNELIVKPWLGGESRDERRERGQWTIVQINEKEVAIRGSGQYVSHSNGDVGRPAFEANEWEILTPVKNDDGTWSFKSRWGKWLSGGGYRGGEAHFMPDNLESEHWKLELWS